MLLSTGDIGPPCGVPSSVEMSAPSTSRSRRWHRRAAPRSQTVWTLSAHPTAEWLLPAQAAQARPLARPCLSSDGLDQREGRGGRRNASEPEVRRLKQDLVLLQ